MRRTGKQPRPLLQQRPELFAGCVKNYIPLKQRFRNGLHL